MSPNFNGAGTPVKEIHICVELDFWTCSAILMAHWLLTTPIIPSIFLIEPVSLILSIAIK